MISKQEDCNVPQENIDTPHPNTVISSKTIKNLMSTNKGNVKNCDKRFHSHDKCQPKRYNIKVRSRRSSSLDIVHILDWKKSEPFDPIDTQHKNL